MSFILDIFEFYLSMWRNIITGNTAGDVRAYMRAFWNSAYENKETLMDFMHYSL